MAMRKILVLEDNKMLAETIATALKTKDRKIFVTPSLEKLYSICKKNPPDLCILDRFVEDGDSIEAIEYLKELYPQTKYIFLTKKSRLLDKINGLEKGADDYLPKPFSLAELRLKVKNMLTWELKQPAVKKIDLGLISFLPESGSFITPDGDIYLRKREKDIIFYLIQAAGRTVSRNHLLRTIWRSEDEAQLNTIDVYIRRLRRKLGKYHTIIQTRRGFGYKIVEFQ